jgi:hypothetical protein
VELQWRRLQKMEMGKGRRWGAAILEGKRKTTRGSSTMPKADDTAKNGVVAGEVEGGS